MSENVTWQNFQPREAREARLGQRPVIAWFTGLSGAGKTSIAKIADQTLSANGRYTTVLDGDNLRHGLNRDLGFDPVDRSENVRRTAEVARLMAETGFITLVALISPSRVEREIARTIAGDIQFIEVFIDTPLPVCEARDPKGLYRLARDGRIELFTGVSAPYEVPTKPDITIYTDGLEIAASAKPLVSALFQMSTLNN